ncbi:glycerophosphoryl diester phosphodiesterase [Emticicia oligotrophica DSM 17448]|uniref:Glycerophosphoryl diester phosphodiesterase n=1 Tax=Emticicia oligotrophica (strain DSM 17448 / CIP 109782 / MTCC 6937 / GPTSA100-15) TaxID=929562 RepID=A0ABM5N025_EMTOG|nr:glycerophosphodiester phosphodiesterase family protein [Emticicia oligotrophica]AFK02790.1 glycerophosphoryl diester phosphodiesterase [Emticicia oligotrophica DSM 17448]
MKTILFIIFPILTFAQSMNFEIQGHRGSRGLMPENTIPAFKKAIDLGVHTLELDVVISKDKKVVVSHDPFFNPNCTTGPSGNFITKETQGNLYQLTYEEIEKYDVGLRGNKDYPEQFKMAVYKPLLEDMIHESEKYAREKGVKPLKYNIEIKSEEKEYGISQPSVEEFSDLVYKVIIKQIPPERVTLQSFDFNVLKFWHKQIEEKKYKAIALSALIEPFDNNDIQFNLNKLGFKPEIWSPYFAQATEKRVKELHELGIKVIPWTVNRREDMEKVKAVGCDGLITDYPDRTKGL